MYYLRLVIEAFVCVSIVCLLGWFAFGVFFVSTMNRYSCTTLDWLLRLSSVCFWRVPAFMFVGVGLLLAWFPFWRVKSSTCKHRSCWLTDWHKMTTIRISGLQEYLQKNEIGSALGFWRWWWYVWSRGEMPPLDPPLLVTSRALWWRHGPHVNRYSCTNLNWYWGFRLFAFGVSLCGVGLLLACFSVSAG